MKTLMLAPAQIGGWGIAVLLCLLPASAGAGCLVDDAAPGAQGLYKMHLHPSCTKTQREAHAVEASTVLAALKRGQTVDLDGAVIHGDLEFDSLPVASNPPALDGVLDPKDKEVRMIAGGLSLVNSVVQGRIVHRSSDGTLVFSGPVTFAGTTFEHTVDLSRAVFTQAVTLSGAVFLAEAYFVQARFLRGVSAEKTAFGPHTRFHRSRFQGPVTFQQSGFTGLAEFLEGRFERDANFAQTYFKSGTGFSGSEFSQLADFSEALFDGDVFFTFTRFDGDAFFRRATFRATADFDDAQFNAREDFSKVFFEKGPQFARARRSGQSPNLGIENPQIQYAITLSLLVFSAVLIAYLVRSR
ncbi:MAG TPA: pentapeptide repeat-containing protein [Nitrospira sp.]|nr:pentapeptide repeat-containing protein [Nitrospira sp.]